MVTVCYWIVLALCVHHACYQRQGHGAQRAPEGAKKQNPPHRASTRGTAAKGGRGERREQPPPPRGPVPRHVLASCPQRACPGGNDNIPETSSQQKWWLQGGDGMCLQSASIMLATSGRDMGHEGHQGGPKGKSPPHGARTRGTQASGAAKKGRGNRKGAGPPSPPTDKCRAACLDRARNVHAMGERTTRAPPPPPHPHRKGTTVTRGRKREAGEVGGGHKGEHRAGERDGRQAERANGRHGRPQPEPGPETDMQSARARKGGGRGRGTSRTRQEPGRAERSAGRGKHKGRKRKGRGQHCGRGGLGRKGPTGDAEGPSLGGLGAPPVTVSAPPAIRWDTPGTVGQRPEVAPAWKGDQWA